MIRAPGGSWFTWVWVIVLPLFLGVLFFPLGLPKAPDHGPVLCDGKVMRPGDTCDVIVNGVGDLRGYATLRAQQDAGRGVEPIALTFGSGMLLIGLGSIGLLIRLLRRSPGRRTGTRRVRPTRRPVG